MYRNHLVHLIHTSVRLSVKLCSHVRFIFLSWRTKIAYDQRLCHDFDPKSFWQVQGHWKETCIILYCFLMEKHWTFLLRKMNAYIWGFVMILTQCHLSKFKIIGKKKFIIRVQSIIFFWETLDAPTSHKDWFWPVGVSWIWLKVLWASSRLLEGIVKSLCLVHIFLIVTHWKFLLYTNLACNSKLCHDFDPRLFE